MLLKTVLVSFEISFYIISKSDAIRSDIISEPHCSIFTMVVCLNSATKPKRMRWLGSTEKEHHATPPSTIISSLLLLLLLTFKNLTPFNNTKWARTCTHRHTSNLHLCWGWKLIRTQFKARLSLPPLLLLLFFCFLLKSDADIYCFQVDFHQK